jgi:hypothetical protein
MKRILFLLLLGMTLLCDQAFAGGNVFMYQCNDANPTPSSTWNATAGFSVCNSAQMSFRVIYNFDFHESCWTNRYRATIKLFWNGNLIATAGPAIVSSMFFQPTFTNITVVPGVWTATATLERRPCIGSWYTAETISTTQFNPAITVTNHCQIFTFCLPNINISGNYTTPLTQASSSITSVNATTIPGGADVRLDANDNTNNGFIELNPGFETQVSAVFIAQALDGCGSGIPAKPAPTGIAEKLPADIWRAYPNPTTGVITVQHPADVQALNVYGIDGKLYQTVNANSNGETKLDMTELTPGIYIIHANGKDRLKLIRQ